MPRPPKTRRVCGLPQHPRFGPLDGTAQAGCVHMTVDEYETIRLIDHLALSQEACAAEMDIARTTVQSIYATARKKVAEALVTGRPLHIGGGAYRLAEASERRPHHGRGHGAGRGGCNAQ